MPLPGRRMLGSDDRTNAQTAKVGQTVGDVGGAAVVEGHGINGRLRDGPAEKHHRTTFRQAHEGMESMNASAASRKKAKEQIGFRSDGAEFGGLAPYPEIRANLNVSRTPPDSDTGVVRCLQVQPIDPADCLSRKTPLLG